MNISSTIALYGHGTSEGAVHGWDTRGRGRHLSPGQTTEDKFRNPETKMWDPDRAKMHEQIISEMIAGKTPSVDRGPVAHVLGGGTASGKTTASRKIIGNDPNVLRVDPDELKTKIPEYEQLKKDDPKKAAFRVHEESSYLTKALMAEAISRGLDLTYDSTTSGKGAMAMINTMLNHGYQVHTMFVDVPLEVAKQRADLRARESNDPMNRGRFIPAIIIEESHNRAAENFFKLRENPELSSVRLFDNTGASPRLILSRSGSDPEVVHDQDRLEQYRQKASSGNA
jgi:predicted ABC-type ATPase